MPFIRVSLKVRGISGVCMFSCDSGLTLVGFVPDDGYVGNRPEHRRCARADDTVIIYPANPDGDVAETDDASVIFPDITVNVDGDFVARWFDLRTGLWRRVLEISAGVQTLVAPDAGDWALLLRHRKD